jgi:hypothetical protein
VKRRAVPFNELFNMGKIPVTNKELHEDKYRHVLGEARASQAEHEKQESSKVKTGYYSLRSKILKNPWVDNKPASQAISWVFKTVFKNPDEYKYKKVLLYQGGLFMFEYKNPKYKGTSVLPWFDQYPLVLSLGPISTNLGVRNIGFNLHILPPAVRIVVLCGVFEIYKKMYRYQLFFKQEKPVRIEYKHIIKKLERMGVKFCVRMYIPQRMREIARFPMKDWHKAVFIPSRGYNSITANKLVNEWKAFCRKNHIPSIPNVNWKSMIGTK